MGRLIDYETEKKVKEIAKDQSTALAAGAAIGAITKQVYTPKLPGQPGGFSAQVGSAMGSAAASGSGINGAVTAGATVVTAKATAIAAVGAAALPYVAIAAAGYGLYKFLKK